jgi:hypothetical protein
VRNAKGIPPEVKKGFRNTRKSDVYRFGQLLGEVFHYWKDGLKLKFPHLIYQMEPLVVCSHSDPEQRLSMSQIRDWLTFIQKKYTPFECFHFWVLCFGHTEEITWEIFIHHFMQYYSISLETKLGYTHVTPLQLECLHAILTHLTKKQNFISWKNFEIVLNEFGPLFPLPEFFSHVLQVSHPAFYGFIDIGNLFQNRQVGDFVVRMTRNHPHHIAFSVLTATGLIHYRILRRDGAFIINDQLYQKFEDVFALWPGNPIIGGGLLYLQNNSN